MRTRATAAAVAILLGGCAGSGAPNVAPALNGYLEAATLDGLAVWTPHPVAPSDPTGDALFSAVAPGTDRWWLATAHAELRPPWAAQHFDCALGARLAERPRPALERTMRRLASDAAALVRRLPAPHEAGERPRPFAAIDGLEPCVRTSAAFEESPSWPAGGAVLAGAWGELFAALAPDAAARVRRTAREIAWSAVVCRTNWPADVEAGLALGAELFREAERTPAFRVDLAAAGVEMAAARAEGLHSPACAAERRALRQWSAPDQLRGGPSSDG